MLKACHWKYIWVKVITPDFPPLKGDRLQWCNMQMWGRNGDTVFLHCFPEQLCLSMLGSWRGHCHCHFIQRSLNRVNHALYSQLHDQMAGGKIHLLVQEGPTQWGSSLHLGFFSNRCLPCPSLFSQNLFLSKKRKGSRNHKRVRWENSIWKQKQQQSTKSHQRHDTSFAVESDSLAS